jgi:Tol biopolymer transport system component
MEITMTVEGAAVATQFAPLYTGIDGPGMPAFSADGSTIAFTGTSQAPCAPGDPQVYPGSLYIMPAAGGSPLAIYCSPAIHGFGIGNPTWSPDGMAIAFAEHVDDGDGDYETYEQEIRICNLVTAVDGSLTCDITTAVSQVEAEGMGGPDWSNDGTALLFDREELGGAHRRTTVCRVSLESNGAWNRVPGSPLDCLVRGHGASWAPDDSKFVTDGIFIYDAVTLRKSKATTGIMPEWRRPPPIGP